MIFLCLVPIVVFAFFARIRRRWFWVVYGIFATIAFLLIWLATPLTGGESLGVILVASLFGFLAPEIWQGTRNAVVNFFSRPQNLKYVLGAGFIVLCLFVPAILGTVLVLVFAVIAFKTILGDFFK